METENEIPADVMAEMQRLKQYFPYRIVYAACNGANWQHGAVTSKREPNRLRREGFTVYLLGSN